MASVKDAPPKGEIVVVIDRAGKVSVNTSDIEAELREALTRMTVKDASELVAGAHGMARRKVYQMALGLDRSDE